MTEEELEKEADKWLVNNLHSTEEDYKQAYLAGAEPREKEIKSLGERCLQLQKDKGELIDKVAELEEKLETGIALKDEEISCILTDFNTFKSKAKEIVNELLSSCFGYNSKTVNYEVKTKAEHFLKEE